MRRWIFVTTVLAAGALAPPASLPAQRPISVGLAGGVSLPQGSLRDGADPGWHALGTIALGTLMQPLGLRLDAAYNRFAFDGGGGFETVTSATLNATYRLPMTNSAASPYLVSGLGAYRTACSLDDGECADATTRYGWNAGVGAKLYALGFRSFVEARYHRTSRGGRAVDFVPITFGVLF